MSAVALPVTLRASKARALLLLVGSLGFVVVGVCISADHPVIGYGNVVFFGLCGLAALVMFHPSAHYLTLGPEGFLFSALFRKHQVRWQDVVEFRTVLICLNQLVVCNYSEQFGAHARLLAVKQSLSLVGFALP